MYFAHVDILTQNNGNALNVTISNNIKIVNKLHINLEQKRTI